MHAYKRGERRRSQLSMPLLTRKKRKELGIPLEGKQKSMGEDEVSSTPANIQRGDGVTNIHDPTPTSRKNVSQNPGE